MKANCFLTRTVFYAETTANEEKAVKAWRYVTTCFFDRGTTLCIMCFEEALFTKRIGNETKLDTIDLTE